MECMHCHSSYIKIPIHVEFGQPITFKYSKKVFQKVIVPLPDKSAFYFDRFQQGECTHSCCNRCCCQRNRFVQCITSTYLHHPLHDGSEWWNDIHRVELLSINVVPVSFSLSIWGSKSHNKTFIKVHTAE